MPISNRDFAEQAGALAAKYAPADPALWFDAAMAAGISQRFKALPNGLQISLEPPADDPDHICNPEAESFLFSWLQGTPSGTRILWEFMRSNQVNCRG